MRKKIVRLTLGAMLVALSYSASAQQPGKIPRIGYLSLSGKPDLRVEVFVQGLRDLGWVDGQNVAIEYRWAANCPRQIQNLHIGLFVGSFCPIN